LQDYPKPDRSNFKPNPSKTEENPEIDIGWDEGFFRDGRPYRAECWATDGITMLTLIFSARGFESYSDQQFASFLESEGLVRFRSDRSRLSAMRLTDAAGNDMWSVNIVVGMDDETYIHDSVKLRSYWSREQRGIEL
jgi:hypothetical protein